MKKNNEIPSANVAMNFSNLKTLKNKKIFPRNFGSHHTFFVFFRLLSWKFEKQDLKIIVTEAEV